MIRVRRKSPHQGFHLTFANGWTLGVQTGAGNCHSNRETNLSTLLSDNIPLCDESPNAEIAVWHRNNNLVQWADGDTVQGWVSPDRIARVISYVSNLPDNPSAWGSGSTYMWLGINGKEEMIP